MRNIDVMTPTEVSDFISKNKYDQLELSSFVIRQVNDLSGVCVEMGKHIETSNGNVAHIQEKQSNMQADIQALQFNQNNLLARWIACLPKWAQKSLIVWCAISILVVPFMSSVIAILAVLMTR